MMQVDETKGFSLVPPTSTNNYLLSPTAIDVTIADITDVNGVKPNYMNFSANGDFYVKWNGTGAAVPAANILTGASPELNPGLRVISGITSFSVVAPTATNLTVNFYS